MSVFNTIGGVAKIVLGGATAADGISDIRKEKKRKQEAYQNDTVYDDHFNETDTDEESEKEKED